MTGSGLAADQPVRDSPPAIASRAGLAARLAIAVAALGVTWLVFGGTWQDLAAPRPETEFILDEDFAGGAAAAGARIESTGFFPCPDGWCVTQATEGVLTYRPPPRSTGAVSRISPWFYMPSAGSNAIAISIDDGKTFVPLTANTNHAGTGFSVPEQLQRGGAPVVLRFTLDNRAPNQALGLDKLLLVYTTGPVPALPLRTSVLLAVLFVLIGIAALTLRPARGLAVVLILTAAAGPRYDALARAVDRPLDPDARVYRQLAGSMQLFSGDHGFYSANFNEREPGFILAVHEFFALTADSEYHLRLLTVTLSLALVAAGMAIAFGLFGTAAGIVVGTLLALNAPLVAESVRGLRLEAETILWLLWLGFVFVWRRPHTLVEFAVAGLLAGAVLLVRSSYGPPLMVLMGLAAWTASRRWPTRLACAVLGLAVMATVVAPHRVAMLHRRGDPFWDTTMYARWLANFEFADRPGFPTRASLELNGYQGPRLTYGQYLFGLHTPAELIGGTLRGYARMVSHMNAPLEWIAPRAFAGLLSAAILLLGLAGLAIALFLRGLIWLPVAFATVLAPAAFLYDRGLLENNRHSYQAFPLLLLAACVACRWTAVRIRSVWRGRAPAANMGTHS